MHQQPTRRVGSIADYDPVNEQYGSITQHNANPAGGGYRQETTYQVKYFPKLFFLFFLKYIFAVIIQMWELSDAVGVSRQNYEYLQHLFMVRLQWYNKIYYLLLFWPQAIIKIVILHYPMEKETPWKFSIFTWVLKKIF